MPSSGARPTPGHDCGSCVAHPGAAVSRIGAPPGDCDAVVALAGNPNTGKSTVFNALTGLRQHVGNWPGTTVARAEGACAVAGRTYRVVDLPGCYSLLSISRDEDVARDFLVFGDPDVVVVVVDATRLARNLNLVLQVLQVTGRVVVALNLMDEARRHGLGIDVRHLTRELGVPVVPMAARRGEGVAALLEEVAAVASGVRRVPRPRPSAGLPPGTARAVRELAALLTAEYPGLPNAPWVALRLLEGDRGTEAALRDGTLAGLVRAQAARSA
ncbi:iron transporter FeoB [Nocardioides sp. dk4132]|nr:iron transporter FeoB [Nocardioides sp. dk4132]QGA09583.1 iron transporter FeoB [Nocardioides sp. dk884]